MRVGRGSCLIFFIFSTQDMHYENFYKLLRIACGSGDSFTSVPDAEWLEIYNEATRQLVLGVVYSALRKLPRDVQPPMEIMFQWASEVENIKGLNELLNSEATRYTQMFAQIGIRSFILKGPANARLYPDAFSRQPGDIDIWVEGGLKKVRQALKKLGFAQGYAMGHHIHLPTNENGVEVEVHFKPSSGNFNPVSSRRLLRYLEAELSNAELTPEGFYVPSMKFALAMQLSHIQRHFVGKGVGFRQLMDYYILLKNSSASDRDELASRLKPMGLFHIAGALMWLLQTVFKLDRDLMLCEPDEFRGKWLLNHALEGGNFGRYGIEEKMNFVHRWFKKRIFIFDRVKFDFWEVLWCSLDYWPQFVKDIPLRIKLRKLSIRNVPR